MTGPKNMVLIAVFALVTFACHALPTADICKLPSESGPCKALAIRYYYNSTTGICQTFNYGGCDGNENNFVNEEGCQKMCFERETTKTDVCSMKPEAGMCEALIPRYFFNATSKQCEKFNYGGCGGNGNNFHTLQYCRANCSGAKKLPLEVCPIIDCLRGCPLIRSAEHPCGNCVCPRPVVCFIPPDQGNCDAIMTRYYFNSEHGKCENFTYGGCGGNDNNFKTLEQCEEACRENNPTPEKDICKLPSKTGPCKALAIRYYYNSTTGACQKFNYGGCKGNENNFVTEKECQKKCFERETIKTDNKPGECPSTEGKVGICILGCQNDTSCPGNKKCCSTGCGTSCMDPKSVTPKVCPIIDCIRGCPLIKSEDHPCGKCVCPRPVVCLNTPDPGSCEALMTRYYFNTEHGKCENFTYGGCGGNGNNFQTPEQCEKSCRKTNPRTTTTPTKACPIIDCIPGCPLVKSEEHPCGKCVCPRPVVCLNRPDPGNCDALITRYYFNTEHGKCEQFTYGGCGGNGNNFQTPQQCEESCRKTNPRTTTPTKGICSLPSDTGPCKAMFTKYYHNSTIGKCEKFIYGGCQGNENKFNREIDCRKMCIEKKPAEKDCPVLECMPGCHMDDPTDESCGKCVCTRKEVCFFPLDTGKCDGAFRRYFYNAAESKCENFTYGGCGGNGNNFETLAECKKVCHKTVRTTDKECSVVKCPRNCSIGKDEFGCDSCLCPRRALCYLPPDAGTSEANITRYFFNPETRKCRQFQYGGADGNDNNFPTKSKCKHTCAKLKKPKAPILVEFNKPHDGGSDSTSSECSEEECPQECAERMVKGCRTCVCDGPFFPAPRPAPSKGDSSNDSES